MRIQDITLDDIELAYKKLKSYIYHENFNLHLRLKLAKYESSHNLPEKFENLRVLLSECSRGEFLKFDQLIRKIDYTLVVKSFRKNDKDKDKETPLVFTENNENGEYSVEKYNPFIDCPIEIHLISILWILKIGSKLDEGLTSSCFGNRLYQNSEGEIEENSLKLFYPYFHKYNEWRDASIKKAKELHNLGLDVILLNLDVESYYHSMDFDISSIKVGIEFKWLNLLLSSIHGTYQDLIFTNSILEGSSRKILPIGLISSNILANYYLKEFDDIIISKDHPAHYGRYVDDINIIYSNPRLPDNLEDFPRQRLTADRWSWGETSLDFNEEENKIKIKVKDNELSFQLKKVKLFYFKHNESVTVLNEFEKEISRNSSEFKFLPETSDIMESFETACYKLSYSDTINKLRSIDKFDPDKLGASKHLSKLIFSTKYIQNIDSDTISKISKEVNSFFSGERGLVLNSLWEKVITFYLINRNKNALIEFARIILKSIDKVESIDKVDSKTKGLKEELLLHFINSLSMAFALDEKFLTEELIKTLRLYTSKACIWEKLDIERLKNNTKHLIQSNLLRHNYIVFPLINYQNIKLESYRNFNLEKWIVPSKENVISEGLPSIDEFEILIEQATNKEYKTKYSPRFVHYHEMCLFEGIKKLNASPLFHKQNDLLASFMERNIANKSFNVTLTDPAEECEDLLAYKIPGYENKTKLTIGLVNIRVDIENSINNFKGRPNLSFSRLYELNQILNQAIKNKCDLIIFPENSIPFHWMPILTDFSRRSEIGIIGGVEHIANENKEVYNYVTVILPFMLNDYRNAFVDFRLKKDYSHSEKHFIEGHTGYMIPKDQMEKEKLRMYQWKGMFFSVFNCFELADISKRALFKGNVDFVVSVEHNKDVNYFSNISESVVRDIHSYFIQVNTSQYGDSRIVKPSATATKDIAKIKGGENVSLLTSTIDIKSLRDFQKKEFTLQKEDRRFKPTPPGFKLNKKRQ